METPLDQELQTTQPQIKPPSFGKIIKVNFLVMLGYMLVTSLGAERGHLGGVGPAMMDMFLIGLQCVFNFGYGIFKVLNPATRTEGQAYLTSFGLIGLIGFGACFVKMIALDSLL